MNKIVELLGLADDPAIVGNTSAYKVCRLERALWHVRNALHFSTPEWSDGVRRDALAALASIRARASAEQIEEVNALLAEAMESIHLAKARAAALANGTA